MADLDFDIYAMVQPKTRSDLLQLAREALSELQIINAALDELLALKD